MYKIAQTDGLSTSGYVSQRPISVPLWRRKIDGLFREGRFWTVGLFGSQPGVRARLHERQRRPWIQFSRLKTAWQKMETSLRQRQRRANALHGMTTLATPLYLRM
jgi:hypothetical protein